MLKSVTVAFLPFRHCLINLPGLLANALLDQGKVARFSRRQEPFQFVSLLKLDRKRCA